MSMFAQLQWAQVGGQDDGMEAVNPHERAGTDIHPTVVDAGEPATRRTEPDRQEGPPLAYPQGSGLNGSTQSQRRQGRMQLVSQQLLPSFELCSSQVVRNQAGGRRASDVSASTTSSREKKKRFSLPFTNGSSSSSQRRNIPPQHRPNCCFSSSGKTLIAWSESGSGVLARTEVDSLRRPNAPVPDTGQRWERLPLLTLRNGAFRDVEVKLVAGGNLGVAAVVYDGLVHRLVYFSQVRPQNSHMVQRGDLVIQASCVNAAMSLAMSRDDRKIALAINDEVHRYFIIPELRCWDDLGAVRLGDNGHGLPQKQSVSFSPDSKMLIGAWQFRQDLKGHPVRVKLWEWPDTQAEWESSQPVYFSTKQPYNNVKTLTNILYCPAASRLDHSSAFLVVNSGKEYTSILSLAPVLPGHQPANLGLPPRQGLMMDHAAQGIGDQSESTFAFTRGSGRGDICRMDMRTRRVVPLVKGVSVEDVVALAGPRLNLVYVVKRSDQGTLVLSRVPAYQDSSGSTFEPPLVSDVELELGPLC